MSILILKKYQIERSQKSNNTKRECSGLGQWHQVQEQLPNLIKHKGSGPFI